MEKFSEKIESKLYPMIEWVQSNKYLSAIQFGLLMTMPVLLVGAFACVISDLPIQAYQDSIAPLTTAVQNINNLYAPILEQTRMFENIYNKSMMAALQSSIPAMEVMADIDLSAIQSIVNAFPKYEFLSESILKNIDFSRVAEMYDDGTITDEDIAEEFGEIIAKKDFSITESLDNVKKSKWFLAIRWLLIVLMFLSSPVIDKVKDNTLDALGVNDFWEESGIYEWLDEVFDVEKDSGVIRETEAKSSVDGSKTGNRSKQKREDSLAKIKEIRNYIAAAPQDENMDNLLSYLSDLEKDVNGKKYVPLHQLCWCKGTYFT